MRKGLIQVYTGNGKGKTTASLGLAIRAVGAGKKVAIIFFDKGGNFYNERKILKQIKGIHFWVTGKKRFDQKKKTFRFEITDTDKKEAQKGFFIADFLLGKNSSFDLVILDEILNIIRLKMLPLKWLIKLLEEKNDKIEVVLTGRKCPKNICQIADLISEIRLKKHYFYQGVKARKGFEF